MMRILFALVLSGSLFFASHVYAETALPDEETLRTWIREMKQAKRGPFKRIRWFCNDGSVLPPKEYACVDHGGGVQHGEWNDRTKLLRDHNFFIANVLAGIQPENIMEGPQSQELLKQILLEQFLITSDDGWILRKARYYRGALQTEDETRSGQELLLALLQDRDWRDKRYTLLREAVRLLPHEYKGAPITEMRQLSRAIAEKDENFEKLRIKIHVKPDADDAERVRAYAAEQDVSELTEEYERLAVTIDKVYLYEEIGPELIKLSSQLKDPELSRELKHQAARLSKNNAPGIRIQAAGQLLAAIRDDLGHAGDPKDMLKLLDVSLELEREVFLTGNDLLDHLNQADRRERLSWVQSSTAALYGTGLISRREWNALQASFVQLTGASPSLQTYKNELDYLSRVPGWSDNQLRFYFNQSVEHLAVIEPLTLNYMHDRLRGSPLLFCAAVVDSLIEDANMNLGIRHEFFGKTVSGGLRGLNPGLARGVLKVPQKGESMTKLDPEGIYVLPATTAELSPVAGIVTAREGNALSHLQLLARNLGIPNVVVDKRLLPRLTEKEGVNVVLAVSPRGVVKIAEDSPKWDQVFIKEAKPEEVLIRPDFKKLNLKKRMLIPLERIRATDSGRIAGPKAANLGELKHQFPEAVTDGLVIPFGLFRSLLNQPIEPDGPPVFRWMQDQYAILQNMRDEPEKLEQATEHFLDRIHEWIVNADPGETYRRQLRTAMDKTFGPDGSYGLFVRSDTNLEDLPGFTGAGLNLTVPNVVGFENIVRAISRVWASPFTERAYAWRQAYMEDPEHVYVSVLLLKSIPADKSGVMVTTDLESGNPGWLSVAANQGVGGAVSGEGAEELRVNVESGKVRLMAQATEPLRRVLPSEGGVKKIPVIETDTVLENHEIAHLIELSRVLPDRFPAQFDAQGEPVPSDIEFGFYQGRLVLFQIRPFLESTHARQSHFLNALDQGLERVQVSKIELDKIPMEESQ